MRSGYPQILVTATTDRAPEFAKRWPNSFWLLGTATKMAVSATEVFTKMRSEGKIGNTIAMVGVADQFGIELSTAARSEFKKANFNLVYDKSYPLGTQDMQPILTEAMRSTADVFFAASYPPDTFAIVDQSKVLNYNPKVFFTSVGTAFPVIKQRFGANAEGIMGTGGWNADSPSLKAFLKRHQEVNGADPDRWASPVTYSSLQMLQQAIERVGKIDRAAVIKELSSGTFETIYGTVKLVDNASSTCFNPGSGRAASTTASAPFAAPRRSPADRKTVVEAMM